MAIQTIVSDPSVMTGKPVVSGTRITVELILGEIAAGQTFDQILVSHPRLTRQGILAAVDYAVKVLEMDEVYSTHEAAR
jgi:uncharacterized protein (DUF433 family)